jgi:hypothetical protein
MPMSNKITRMRTMTPTLMYMTDLRWSGPRGTHQRSRRKLAVRRILTLTLAIVMVAASGLVLTPASANAANGAQPTVWLCKPGLPANPCDTDLSITRYDARGRVIPVVPVTSNPKVDCFYVYPTTSDQPAPQANFDIRPELRSTALYQAARYASDCRVFAPIYRQITINGLFGGNVTPEMRETAYQDVRSAWLDYLATENDGRGVVFIGHSQGTGALRRLLREEVDPNPAVRSLLVSALLLGSNVTVKKGQDIGGDFQHIPACRSRAQLGCVVAFSTFGGPVPAASIFGRTSNPELEVLCTNPAALAGGSVPVSPSQPTAPFAPGTVIGNASNAVGTPAITATTAFVEYRYAYRAACVSDGNANVLRVTPLGVSPALNAIPDATWGLHLVDANIVLGDLVKLVHWQVRALGSERASAGVARKPIAGTASHQVATLGPPRARR